MHSWRTFLLGALALSCWLMPGCSRPWVSDKPVPVDDITLAEDDQAEVTVVRDWAGPWAMLPFKGESIALVTGLKNSGSDPPQSPQRDILLGEMKTRSVANPNAVLASPRTSMVFVRAFLPPGVQKGDRVDIELRVLPRSETESLEGGWLMPTRLTEMAVLEGRLQTGHDRAIAQGHLLTDAVIEGSEDPVAMRRGRILGGGVALQSRPLGLAVRSDHKSVRKSSIIADAVNKRFSIFDAANIKRGVATPKDDSYIELAIYPRYQDNLWRYIRVVGEVPLNSRHQHHTRLESLGQQLLEPTSASRAALKLEAVGKEAIPFLEKGLASDNQEVRFYSAEALAYLDHPPAARQLAVLAASVPAFRWHALTALSAMDDLAAVDEIANLLHIESAETRYGAFRAMLTRNAQDPAVKGVALGDHLMLHTVSSEGPPMIHISRSRQAEVVIFGDNVRINGELVLATDNHITLKSLADGQIRVSRFAPGEEDKQITCSTRLDDVVKTLIDVGATYPDVANVIRTAKQRELLSARVEVDALPKPGRTYDRRSGDGSPASDVQVASPLPTLFTRYDEDQRGSLSGREDLIATEEDLVNEPEPAWWDVIGRMRD